VFATQYLPSGVYEGTTLAECHLRVPVAPGTMDAVPYLGPASVLNLARASAARHGEAPDGPVVASWLIR
jgi:hypothetical protein